MRLSFLFVAVLALAASAHAQAPEAPRVGTAVDAEGEDVAILWIGPETAFVGDPRYRQSMDDAPEVLCIGDRCAPVVARQVCDAPECPFLGLRLRAARALAGVSPWTPEAIHEVHREPGAREVLRWEEASLAERFPPDMPNSLSVERARFTPSPWTPPDNRTRIGVEASLGFVAGRFVQGSGASLGASLELCLQFDQPAHFAEGIHDGFLFDGIGIGVRARVLGGGGDGARLMIAGSLNLTNRIDGTIVRIPSLLGLLLPGIGGVFDSDGSRSAYFGWSAPITILLASLLAINIQPEAQLIFPPREADPFDLFIGVSIGVALVQVGVERPRRRRGSLLSW